MPKINYLKNFQRITTLKHDNSRLMSELKNDQESGRSDASKITTYSEMMQENNKTIAKLRNEIVRNMNDIPAFKNDKRFKKIPESERIKMERFYESMSADRKIAFMGRPSFEEHCAITVNNYDNIVGIFGEAFPESFTDCEKLSTVFVGQGLSESAIDFRTQKGVKVDVDTLKLCSYPPSEVENFDARESLGIMEQKSKYTLDDVFQMLVLRKNVVVVTRNFVDNKIAENPEGATALLTKDEVQDVTDKVLKLGIVDKENVPAMRDSVAEQVAVCSASRVGAVGGVAIEGAELRQIYNLPMEERYLEVHGTTLWLTEDGLLTTEQLDQKYQSDMQADVVSETTWYADIPE